MPFCFEWIRNRYSVMMRLVALGLSNGSKGLRLLIRPLDRCQTLTVVSGCLFHGVDDESILGDDEAGRARLEYRFEMAITFDATVGSLSNSYWSFRMPFCMEWMRNRYSVMMRSGRARLE